VIFLDLFAGIGGFALGAKWAGLEFDAHYFSEVDPYAISVYSKRFPNAIPLGDIRTITADSLPRGDWIIAGGFPCQDISVAGKGAGLAGERSGLWYEYARIIGELRPRFAIMENVGALAFRGLDSVLGSLAALGYDAEWQDIRASDVGAPHRRERVWIVAYPMLDGRGPWRPECSGLEGRAAPIGPGFFPNPFGDGVRHEPGRGNGQDGTSEAEPFDHGEEGALADATSARRDASEGKEQHLFGSSPQAARLSYCGNVADADRGRLEGLGERGLLDGERAASGDDVDGCDCAFRGPDSQGLEEREGGRPRGPFSPTVVSDWWATEPDICRVAHGIPSRVDRLKCLGNSIVPQIAEFIFREIGGQLDGP
jgi:DNA (cytosine-5)-methyltransferase 1